MGRIRPQALPPALYPPPPLPRPLKPKCRQARSQLGQFLQQTLRHAGPTPLPALLAALAHHPNPRLAALAAPGAGGPVEEALREAAEELHGAFVLRRLNQARRPAPPPRPAGFGVWTADSDAR